MESEGVVSVEGSAIVVPEEGAVRGPGKDGMRLVVRRCIGVETGC